MDNRIRESLELLEQAQGLVNQAAQALCPVPGFGDEWSSLHDTYDAVKAAWHRVDGRRQALGGSIESH